MTQRKIAITRVEGNDETVLKLFEMGEKTAAMAYGSEVAKSNTSGTVACIQGLFDTASYKRSGTCRVYEVWE